MSKEEQAGARSTVAPGGAIACARSTASRSEEQLSTGIAAAGVPRARPAGEPRAHALAGLADREHPAPARGEDRPEEGEVAPLVPPAEDQKHGAREGLQAAPRGLDVRGLRVVVVGDTADRGHVLEHVLDAAETPDRAGDRLPPRAQHAT